MESIARAKEFHSPVAKLAAGEKQEVRPLVSLVVPAYNEAAILWNNLRTLCEYMESLEDEYSWEVILVDDGSTDGTGELAEAFAAKRNNIRVLHHVVNLGMGKAFRSAFNQCRGDYVIALDVDLSYSPDHVRRLLKRIRETKAKIVIASPYMEGGKVSNVPWLRRILSACANRFLSLTSKGNLSTLTGMVRAYDGRFLRSIDLKSTGMEINAEIIYKAMLLHALIEEIPAHLDWKIETSGATRRRSSMKLLRHTSSVLLSGFLFRPVVFFLVPGFGLALFSLYVVAWMVHHFVVHYQNLTQYTWFLDRASAAVAVAYSQFPHTFNIGLMASMLSIQLIGLGIMSLQSKRYFEEVFHLGTAIYRRSRESEERRPEQEPGKDRNE